jgi:hypothetical protein
MKCPFCLANCLASDSKCLACNRSFEVVRVRSKSAMWVCIPLFMLVGPGIFIAVWTPPPQFGSAGPNWTYVNQVALVSLACALLGAVVGWILDYLARK